MAKGSATADTTAVIMKLPRSWVVSALVVMSACGTRAPGSAPPAVAAGRTTDIFLATEVTRISAQVTPGTTIDSILRAHDVDATEIAELVRGAAGVFDLRKVRTGQPYRLEMLGDRTIRRFEYEIDGDQFLQVARDAGELVATLVPIEKTRAVQVVSGQIDRSASSLVAAMHAAGESMDLTLALADIFSGEIDFNTELQPGDRFEVLVEKQYRETGTFAGYGPVLAAELINEGRRVRAVRFAPDGEAPAYFDESGASMRRFFLKSPLKFDPVITSGFSRSRLHPVLNRRRPHLGVDYRAPAGAPVIAVAAGSVTAAGRNGGAGRMVRLRHSNGYETEYLHLSAITVRAGARVRQGDVIGRVGATGLATGPHLDYRVRKRGVFVNPVTAFRELPPSYPIPPLQRERFVTTRDQAFAALSAPGIVRVANSNVTVK
jgi:murein DD-endopeptidase MepM/ murein hydrolase activator NlpD